MWERIFVMRNIFLGVLLAFSLATAYAPRATAQTKQPTQSNAASGSFDPHDLSGVWMQDRPRMSTVLERYWIYELTQEEPAMTAWGLAQYKAAKSSFGVHAYPIAETNDPIYRTCSPTGLQLHAVMLPLATRVPPAS
jgi:hypothetical protein